jgi:hypothetical protein
MNMQKKEKRNFVLAGLFLLTMLLSMSCILGAVSVVSPTAGANITGSFFINCSYVNGSDITSPVAGNISFRFNSTGGQEIFLTRTGLTITDNSVSATLTSSEVTKGNGVITCMLGNATNSAGYVNGTSSQVTIYASTPTCAYTFDPTTQVLDIYDQNGIVGKSTSTKDSLTTLTYAWKLYDDNKKLKDSSTLANPTFSGSDLDTIGDYILALTITDGFGNKNSCTNKTFTVSPSNDNNAVAIQQQVQTNQANEEKSNTALFVSIAVIIIILLAIAGFYAISSSKKKK